MKREHRDTIQSNFISLVERTDLDSIVTALYEKGVFSEQMIEPFKNNNIPEKDRKRRLYMDVTRRGPDAFRHLVDTLGELGYWDLARDLDPDSPYSFAANRIFHPLPTPKPSNSGDDNFRSLIKNKQKNETQKSAPRATTPPPPPPLLINDNAAGDVPIVPQFTVKKSTKFMEDDDTKDVKLYRTRGRSRGMLLEFTYMEFDNNIETYRSGVDVDRKTLNYLFSELGFRVLSYLNLTKEETVETLKNASSALEGMETVFVAVSSHGYERANTSDIDVRCSDGRLINLYQIMDYFNNRNMPGLIGVPKVFIFQMCRGSNSDYAWNSPAPAQMAMPGGQECGGGVWVDGQRFAPAPPTLAPAPPRSPAPPSKTALYSDILIAHSTLPGLVAHRDGKLGSWYIQVLCEVFAERAHDCHVEKLFTLVDQRMQDKFRIQTSSVDRWGFNKRLYLHPGLYEP